MSAAGAIGSFLSFLGVCLLSGALGYFIDFINGQTAFYAISHGTMNAMNLLTWMFWAFPFIFLFAVTVNYIIIGMNETTGYG
jgi:hypothetical protein